MKNDQNGSIKIKTKEMKKQCVRQMDQKQKKWATFLYLRVLEAGSKIFSHLAYYQVLQLFEKKNGAIRDQNGS